MTITEERPALWSAMPGWGIAADLIPPELINARQLKVLRKLMAAGIVALLVVCAGGYYLAAAENSSASADLATVRTGPRSCRGWVMVTPTWSLSRGRSARSRPRLLR